MYLRRYTRVYMPPYVPFVGGEHYEGSPETALIPVSLLAVYSVLSGMHIYQL